MDISVLEWAYLATMACFGTALAVVLACDHGNAWGSGARSVAGFLKDSPLMMRDAPDGAVDSLVSEAAAHEIRMEDVVDGWHYRPGAEGLRGWLGALSFDGDPAGEGCPIWHGADRRAA